MPPALTAVLIVVGAAIASVGGLLLAGAIASDGPDQFFNGFFFFLVLAYGGIGGLVVGAAAAIVWSVVSARPRPVRAVATGIATILVMALGVVFVASPSGAIGVGLLLFLPAGILAAITTASVAALARQLEPQEEP